jgi:S-DNA-T family DNA segregation ATPase FtsK/SpoIIIE
LNESGCDEDEKIIQQCIEVIRSEQKASVSLLQRRLRLGYGRAARIMDELENRGIVGPNKGAEPRDILIDLDGTGADGAPAQTS